MTKPTLDEVKAAAEKKLTQARHELQEQFPDFKFTVTGVVAPKTPEKAQIRSTTTVPVSKSAGAHLARKAATANG